MMNRLLGYAKGVQLAAASLAVTISLMQGRAEGQAKPADESGLAGPLHPAQRASVKWWQKGMRVWMDGDMRYSGWQKRAGHSLAFGDVIDLSNHQAMTEFRRLKDAGVRVLDYVTIYHHPNPLLRVKEGWWEKDHPNWYVVDAEGEFLETTFDDYRPGWLQTCVNHPGFVADVLRHVAEVVEAGADGVFVDQVAAMSRCFGPETKKHPHRIARTAAQKVHIPVGCVERAIAEGKSTDPEAPQRGSDPTANAALVALLADIRRVMHEINPQAVLMINTRDVTAIPPQMWRVIDIAVFESFVTTDKSKQDRSDSDNSARWLPWSLWYESMLQCLPFLQQGKRVLAYSYFGRLEPDVLKADSFHAYCTAKLFDAIWGKVDDETLGKALATKLGRPRIDRPLQRDGVYFREYENGMVVINPSEENKRFTWREPTERRVFDHYAGRELEGGEELTVDIPPESGRLYEYEVLPEGKK